MSRKHGPFGMCGRILEGKVADMEENSLCRAGKRTAFYSCWQVGLAALYHGCPGLQDVTNKAHRSLIANVGTERE